LTRIVFVACVALVCCSAADFKLGHMLKPRMAVSGKTERLTPRPTTEAEAPMIALDIVTTGTPADETQLKNPANWSVSVAIGKAIQPIALKEVQWIPKVARVTLLILASEVTGIDPENAHWAATFNIIPPQSATWEPQKKKGTFAVAKGKDDADLYLFGSFLAGESTKPLYMIDAKGNWMWTKGEWDLGIKSALSTNASAQTPVDRTRIDPDSITAAFSAQRIFVWRVPGIEGLDLNLQPLGGEFSRKTTSSDIVGAAQAKLVTKPWFGPIRWVAVYPVVGYEGGHSLNQPTTLFKEKVNLTGWNGISRAVLGINGEYYWLSKKPTADDTYRFTIDASYQSRILFEPEPFVTVLDVKTVPTYTVTLGRRPRPEAEVHITWNFSKYTGLSIQYKYGSLPPLFQFVDHQATVGLTFRAKQAK
jgi:hypothetical protein